MIRTPDEVRQEFLFTGTSISEWAKKNGYSYHLVQQVLSGRSRNLRGKSHEIAVLLGLKEGVIVSKK